MKKENLPRITTDFDDDNFNSTLNGDDTNNPANEMIRPSRPNTLGNTTPVAPPEWEEVTMAIQRLKLNKASGYDGLHAELFKAGGDELVRCMQHMVTGEHAK